MPVFLFDIRVAHECAPRQTQSMQSDPTHCARPILRPPQPIDAVRDEPRPVGTIIACRNFPTASLASRGLCPRRTLTFDVGQKKARWRLTRNAAIKARWAAVWRPREHDLVVQSDRLSLPGEDTLRRDLPVWAASYHSYHRGYARDLPRERRARRKDQAERIER